LNEEANLNIRDHSFVTIHRSIFEEDLSRSREVTPDEWRMRPWSEKFTSNAAGLFRLQM
jgi:cardiolipin synthase